MDEALRGHAASAQVSHLSHTSLYALPNAVWHSGDAMTEVQSTKDGLSLSGFLDVRGVSEVRSALHSWLESSDGDLVLDVRSLVAIDATGLALLVSVHRRALNQGRHLVLDGVGPTLARLLAVTRLHRVLTVRRAPTSSVSRPRSAA